LILAYKERDMDTNKTTENLRGLSIASFVFGFLGGIFYWWVPMGMVMGLTGLLSGLVDWTMARRRSLDYRLSILAIVLAVAVLALDITIAALGWQKVTFGGQ
jgi:hypothetical protein